MTNSTRLQVTWVMPWIVSPLALSPAILFPLQFVATPFHQSRRGCVWIWHLYESPTGRLWSLGRNLFLICTFVEMWIIYYHITLLRDAGADIGQPKLRMSINVLCYHYSGSAGSGCYGQCDAQWSALICWAKLLLSWASFSILVLAHVNRIRMVREWKVFHIL